MRAFAELYDEIDTTTSTNLKVAAMVRYFRSAAPADAAWAAYMLSGRRLKRFIGPALLRRWLVEASQLPQWLVEESHSTVGDLAEMIALLLEDTTRSESATADIPLATWIEERLLPLRQADEPRQREEIIGWWRTLPYRECFLLNKLLTGELRVGVSELLVTRALSEVLEVSRADIARRHDGRLASQRGVLGKHCARASRRRRILRNPIRSFSLRRWKMTLRPWAARPTGRSNGSGTASARRSSAATASASSGREARIS